jgi:hypothetical protein
MEQLNVCDLVEGKNDWCNIPEILRASLKILVDEVQRQQSVTQQATDDADARAQRASAAQTESARVRFEAVEADVRMVRGQLQRVSVRSFGEFMDGNLI